MRRFLAPGPSSGRPSFARAFLPPSSPPPGQPSPSGCVALVDIISHRGSGNPKDVLSRGLAARFGGSNRDYLVADFIPPSLAIFFPSWAVRESAIHRSPFLFEDIEFKISNWTEVGELGRGHLLHKASVKLHRWPILCWNADDVRSAVSCFGELWEIDPLSERRMDVSFFRVKIRCQDVHAIPESLHLMVADRRFIIPIEVESWEDADPILMSEEMDHRLGLVTAEAQERFINRTGFSSIPARGEQGWSRAPHVDRGCSYPRQERVLPTPFQERAPPCPRRERSPVAGEVLNLNGASPTQLSRLDLSDKAAPTPYSDGDRTMPTAPTPSSDGDRSMPTLPSFGVSSGSPVITSCEPVVPFGPSRPGGQAIARSDFVGLVPVPPSATGGLTSLDHCSEASCISAGQVLACSTNPPAAPGGPLCLAFNTFGSDPILPSSPSSGPPLVSSLVSSSTMQIVIPAPPCPSPSGAEASCAPFKLSSSRRSLRLASKNKGIFKNSFQRAQDLRRSQLSSVPSPSARIATEELATPTDGSPPSRIAKEDMAAHAADPPSATANPPSTAVKAGPPSAITPECPRSRDPDLPLSVEEIQKIMISCGILVNDGCSSTELGSLLQGAGKGKAIA